MEYTSQKRSTDKWWGFYDYLNGNLVGLSHLDIVKKFNSHPALGVNEHHTLDSAYNTVLYLHGDSYSAYIQDVNFKCISGFQNINRYSGGNYTLDRTKRNILIIEIAEMQVRDYFGSLRMIKDVYEADKRKEITGLPHLPVSTDARYLSFFPDINTGLFFNKNINQNLECNLFNYNFMMPMFGSKAALNYYFFHRASGDVVISNDWKFLLQKESTIKYRIPITSDEMTELIENLNKIGNHYKQYGFSEIYLSIIPCTATIAQPEEYNNFIPLIQNDPRLALKIIDIYSVMKNSPEEYLCHGDTHWNINGKQKWVEMINEILAKNQTQLKNH